MEDYVFKSELLQSVLPMGVTDISHVKRGEVSGYLVALKEAAKNAGYIEMFVFSRIAGKDSWTEESISRRLIDINKDITALKWRLSHD